MASALTNRHTDCTWRRRNFSEKLSGAKSNMLGRLATDSPEVGVQHRALSFAAPFKTPLLVAAALLISLLAWFGLQVVILDHTASAALNVSVDRPKQPLSLDTPITVNSEGAGVTIQSARLFRTDNDLQGASEEPVAVRLQATADNHWQVVSENGLRPDGDYRLAVQFAAPRPSLP